MKQWQHSIVISVKWIKQLLMVMLLVGLALLLWKPQLSSAMEAIDKSPDDGVKRLVYQTEQSKLSVNDEALTLDPAPVIINDKLYMPLKFVTYFFGLNLSYDAATKDAVVTGEDFTLLLNMKQQRFQLNGEALEQSDLVFVSNERMMLQLSWLSEQLGATYEEKLEEHQIAVTFTPRENKSQATSVNAKPIAKFVVNKTSYAMGEKITYTNLSYDPDSDAIALSWEGKQDAFFIPGEHKVTLVATDQNGYASEPYTRTIVVTNKLVLSELEFNIVHQQVGWIFAANDTAFNDSLLQLPEVRKKQRGGEQRKLLVSDSPENIKEQGILYEDAINGSARLYANHLNGTENELALMIYASNRSSKPIKLTTERKGQSAPSQHALLVGSEAVIDYFIDDSAEREVLLIPPGETVEYYRFPTLLPQYGINGMFDVHSDGELVITFAALTGVDQHSLEQLPKLPYNGHVRGSFQQASFVWDIYPSKRNKHTVQRLMIGDGASDPFLQGVDALQNREASLYGNYGVFYDIHIHKPRRMAVLLMARGGSYKGAVQLNGQLVRVPVSGILEAKKELVTIAKLEGTEKVVNLKLIAPAGSSLPIMLIFYPID